MIFKKVCMYVCIEVALRGDAHGIGRSNWAKGRDPSGSWVQYPNHAVPSIPRHSRWVIRVHLCAFSEPTLLFNIDVFEQLAIFGKRAFRKKKKKNESKSGRRGKYWILHGSSELKHK